MVLRVVDRGWSGAMELDKVSIEIKNRSIQPQSAFIYELSTVIVFILIVTFSTASFINSLSPLRLSPRHAS